MSVDPPVATYLSLRKRHLKLLSDTVPDDKSKAAQIIFDSIINGTEQTNRL